MVYAAAIMRSYLLLIICEMRCCGHIPLCPCQPSCFQLLVGDTTNKCGLPQSTRSLFHVRTFWLHRQTWRDHGAPKRGAHWFVALWCCVDECAFSPSTQAQDHVRDLAECKRAELAHCPTGATSGGTGGRRNFCGHTTLTRHAPCPLHYWGART